MVFEPLNWTSTVSGKPPLVPSFQPPPADQLAPASSPLIRFAGEKPAAELEADAEPPLEARATLVAPPPPAALTTCERVVLVEVALVVLPA